MSKFGSLNLVKFLAIGGLLFLAACEEEPSGVTPGFYRGDIVESSLIYAQSKGPVLAQIYGDPYGLGNDVLGEKVRHALIGHFQAPIIKFTGSEAEAGSPNIRIRIAFGFPEDENSRELCGKEIPQLSSPKEKLIATSVFCMDGEMLAEASGWTMKVHDPDSRGFSLFVSDLARSVMGKSGR